MSNALASLSETDSLGGGVETGFGRAEGGAFVLPERNRFKKFIIMAIEISDLADQSTETRVIRVAPLTYRDFNRCTASNVC
jgi:hypothetical protein